jgi:hypothetical protein
MSNPFEDLRQAVVVRPINSPGPQGAAAPELKIQYSYDGSSWHDDPLQTDRYLRFSTNNGVSWSDAIYFNNLAETLEWVEKARQWAENPENVPVIAPDQYSALHHASRAARSEENAEAAALDAAGSAAEAFGAAAPAWDSETIYSYNDVVSFDNGHTYRCIGENIIGADHAPNINGVDNETDWIRITVALNGFFEYDEYGDLMPMIAPITSDIFMLDENGDIMYRDDDTIDEQFVDNEATLRNMIIETGNDPISITIYTNIPITSGDLIIPSNVHLHFANNGKLSPAYGITVTLDCVIDAGPWKIFDGEGTFNGSPGVDAVYPEWWGAVGDGIADDTKALQAAADFCFGNKNMLKTLRKTYRITSTLQIRCHADMSLSRINSDASFSPSIKVGDDNSYTYQIYFKGPVLYNTTKQDMYTGWGISQVPYPGAIGIQAINLNECDFTNKHIQNFCVGLQVTANSNKGNAYNVYRLGMLVNNKINLQVMPLDEDSWCNENYFEGGRCQFYEIEAQYSPGTRHIELSRGNSIFKPDGNTFVKPSIENDFCEYKLFLDGDYNTFIGCRWEGTSTYVAFYGTSDSPASDNIFVGGWRADMLHINSVELGSGQRATTILAGKKLLSSPGVNAVMFYGDSFSPNPDGIMDLGKPDKRWNTIYATTGIIQTSDEKEKTQLMPMEEAERNVALKIKSMMGKFKFLDAVNKKGEDNARIHFGTTAQNIAKAFESEGLDPRKYGMFCYDEWEADPENGIEAGSRYGIRYNELLAFLIAAL